MEIHPEEERRVEGHIAPGRPSIGLDHVYLDLFPKKPYQLCLYVNPTILTVVTIFLLLCFIATGIYGIVGDEYIEISSSAIGVILSVMETVLLAVTVKALINHKKADDVLEQNADYVDDPTEIHLSADLQEISLRTGVILLIGLILLNSTLACVFWGCAIANMELSPPEIYPYFLADILLGVVAPITFVVSIYILIAVGSYVMYGDLTPQAVVPGFLSFVQYNKDNKEEQYWIIVKYFTFPVRTRGIKFWKNLESGKRRCILPLFNLSTWCLNTMMAVTFCLSITYIVGALVSNEEVINSCSELQDKEMNCFEHISYQYVNCSNESLVGKFNCFRFNTIGVQNDPISTVIKALFLYIACDKFLTVLFNFASQLFRIRSSRIWGAFITVTGSIFVIISFSSLILYRVLHTTSFDFLSLLQFFIISMDILLAGILLSIVTTRRAKKTTPEDKIPPKENEYKPHILTSDV